MAESFAACQHDRLGGEGGVGSLRLVSRHRLIPLLVALVLFTAAILKTHAILTDAPAEPGLLGSPWFQLGLIEVESGLALALACAFRPQLCRVMGMLLFSAFFGLALSRAGASSCACLGRLETPPIATAAADLVILLLLWSWRPEDQGVAGLRLFSRRAFIAGLLILTVLLPLSVASSRAFLSSSPLLVANSVDLGAVSQGQRVEFTLQVQNPQDHDVLVTALDSSCPCLEPVRLEWRFAAREERAVRMVLNLAKEPDFLGRLLIQFRGRTAAFDEAIRGQIQVLVASRS